MTKTLIISRDLSGTISAPVSTDNNELIMTAINQFGFLIPYGNDVTFPEFAQMISEYSSAPQAQAIAEGIKNTLQMTLVVYKDRNTDAKNIVFKRSFVVSNVDASESYAEQVLKANYGDIMRHGESPYTQLLTPEGGAFLSGHINDHHV